MESHSDGELWAIATIDDDHVVTAGDDNKLKVWTLSQRLCEGTFSISSQNRKAPRGGASTLSDLPASQQARALAYNLRNDHVAVGHNDGTLTIRSSWRNLDDVIHEN